MWSKSVRRQVRKGGIDAAVRRVVSRSRVSGPREDRTYPARRRLSAGGGAPPSAVARRDRGTRPPGGRALRTGLRLELRSRDRAVVLEDDCTSTESAVRYFFESHLADIGYFLVKADLHEGRAFLLVNDKTGDKTWLKGPPVVSPDNKRFVTASMDLEAGYNPNEIQVWRLEPSGADLEYSANFGEQWGPSDPFWKDAETISFKKNVLDPGSPGQLLSAPAILRRNENRWELHIPPR